MAPFPPGEVYTDANAGSGKTLAVNSYMVIDGNGGNNYSVTTVANTTGVINRASLTLTATTNTKIYDGKTTAAASPSVSGLIGSDTAAGLAETYADASTGTSKMLLVSAYIVNDGNGGNNYTITKVVDRTGVISANLAVTVLGGNTIVAGQNFLFIVQAVDTSGNPISNYSGPSTIAITSAHPIRRATSRCLER